MNAGRQLLRASVLAAPRQGQRQYTSLKRIKEIQAHFQKDDGLPVHLKNGKSDLYLYRFMWISTLLMTIHSGVQFYKLAFKLHKK